MKNTILSIAVLFLSTSALAQTAQGIETNGSDGIVAEFFDTFDQVIANLNPRALTAEDRVMVEKLQDLRAKVSVTTGQSFGLMEQKSMPSISPAQFHLVSSFHKNHGSA